VEPDNPLVAFENTVEWTLFKLRAQPAALDSLVNILAWSSIRHEKIAEVTIA
jgi:hypothetical protein